MAYDTKSNIGPQIANPGTPNLDEVIVFQEQLVQSGSGVQQVQSGSNIQQVQSGSNIQQVQSGQGIQSVQSGVGIQQVQSGSNIQSVQSGSNIQSVQSGTGLQTVQIQSGMQKQKILDLLDMTKFGSNTDVLRKNLAITDAIQSNTDIEYGTIRCEGNLSFSNIAGETITYSHNQQIYQTYLNSAVVNSPDIVPLTLTFSNANHFLSLPNVFYQRYIDPASSDYVSIQWIGDANNLTYVGTGVATTSTNTTGTLNPSSQVIRDLSQTLDGQFDKISIRIENRDPAKSIRIESKMFSNPVTDLDIVTDEVASYTSKTKDFFITGGPYIWYLEQLNIFIDNVLTAVINVGLDQSGTLFYYGSDPLRNISSMQLTLGGLPLNTAALIECSITITLFDDATELSSCQFVLDKTAIFSEIVYWDIAPLVDSNSADTKLLDFEKLNIVYGEYQSIALTNYVKNINKISVDEDKNSIFFSCPDTVKPYAYRFDNEVEYSNVNMNYPIYEINLNTSIGIAVRSDNSLSLCCKFNNTYYTATNGSALALSKTNLIKRLSIVTLSANNISFVVTMDNDKKYYALIRNILDFSSGMLYKESWHNVVFFDVIEIQDRKLLTSISNIPYDVSLSGDSDEIFTLGQISLNGDTYAKDGYSITAKLDSTNKKVALIDKVMLGNSVLRMISSGEYVSSGLSFPMSLAAQHILGDGYGDNAISGKLSVNLYTTPAIDATTKTFKTLPLRLIDEYPSIYNNAPIGDKSFTIGKTRCVSTDGTIYAVNEFALCGDPSQLLLSEIGTIYESSGYFFLSKDSETYTVSGTDYNDIGLTNVYQFTELGMQLKYVIEDQIICNPVKCSFGIVACGRKSIWICDDNSATKVWTKTGTALIEQVSLKTTLDNSVVAIIDDGTSVLSKIVSNDTKYIVSSDSYNICGITISFIAVTINQLGYVSSQTIQSSLASVGFVDINSTSKLILLDLEGSSTINSLIKTNATSSNYYSIQSNQNVEYYGDSLKAELTSIEVFYKGSGTLALDINGTTIETKTLSSATRYTSVRFYLTTPVSMNMLSYKFTAQYGVILLQRILGSITIKEVYNG